MTKTSNPPVFFSSHALQAVPWMVLGKTIAFFVYFGISVLLVRGLTPHQYGEYSLCRAIAEYLIRLAGLGLNFTLLRYVPELMLAQNLAGIKRLLTKTAYVQLGLLSVLLVVLLLSHDLISSWLKIDARHFSLFIFLMALGATLKNFGNDISTAIYQSRFLTLVSIVHSIIWLSLLSAFLYWGLEIEGALLATAIAALIVGTWNVLRITRYFRSLPWRSPTQGIGRKRVLRLALPMLFNDLINIMIINYTEVFFLGFFFTPVLVAYYDIGYQLPMLVITFIPLALQSLFASAFGEAYTKDNKCLPDLVRGYFQILTMVTVPTACFGFFFATSIVTLVYGEKMLPAAHIVGFFSLFHMMTQFSIPPSMAINAMEKTVNTLWFGIVELCVAIALDVILISRFGLEGAVAAVVCAFIMTLPLRIWLIRQLVGGVYFPGPFVLRIFLYCAVCAFATLEIVQTVGPAMPALQLPMAMGLYAILLLLGIRFLPLVNHDDVARFRTIGVEKLNRVLTFLVRE